MMMVLWLCLTALRDCLSINMITIIVPGRYPGLNEFIDANRIKKGKWNRGNTMKQRDQRAIRQYIPHGLKFQKRIFIEYYFYEPNARRDKDNIAGYFHKVFQDALVQAGCIANDGWHEIKGWSDNFDVDKAYPRIEVVIKEIK